MAKSTKSYTKTDVDRFRQLGDVTENGVTYDSWMVGSSGMSFCLLQQPHHTGQDINLAKRYLKRDRDVIRITVAEVDRPEKTETLSGLGLSRTRFSH